MSGKRSATAVALLHSLPAPSRLGSARQVARSMQGFQALWLSVTGGGLQPAAAANLR